MKFFLRYRRAATVFSLIAFVLFLFTQCISQQSKEDAAISNAKGQQFAGAQSCAGCHKSIYDDHLHTAHYLSSQPAEEKFIKGSFETGRNEYAFNQSVVVAMEKRTDGFYQVEYFAGAEKKAHRFDIVVGSGTMGQSFLYWRDNYLFQLPITYFTAANQWSNSPGFPDKVVFNRVITSRCLECHSTFAQTISEAGKEPEQFNRNKIMYGVSCEKCHGPAAAHVAFQTKNPGVTTGKYIVNPAHLSRQQNMDLCASCHGGRLQKTKPSFSFTAGDTLSNYFMVDTAAPDPQHIDVHGNQNGLLRASKCYRMSQTLTCNSCHNTHVNEKGNTAIFSQRCINCHNEAHQSFCTLKTIGKALLTQNCVDCHMPVKPSKAIAVYLPGNTAPTAALIRSHFISIYPEETKKFLAALKQ